MFDGEGLLDLLQSRSRQADAAGQVIGRAGKSWPPRRAVSLPLPKRLELGRLVRNLKALKTRRTGPDTVVGTILEVWRSRSYPALQRAGLPHRASLSGSPAVLAFVSFLCKHPPLESAYWLSSAYALLVNDDQRRALAMFFTPPPLTDRLLDDLENAGVDFRTSHFCDPACGGAAFLAPIALRIRDALKGTRLTDAALLKHIERHVTGRDKDKTLAKLSRFFLSLVLYEEIREARYVPRFDVSTGDSLVAIPLKRGCDVVISNPPFRKMKAAEVAPYRKRFADVIEAQPNLYGLFIARCIGLVKPGGICALVTPTSFLSGRDFSKLRIHLKSRSDIRSIDLVSARSGVFIDVEQETALTIVQRKRGADAKTPTRVGCISAGGRHSDFGYSDLPRDGSPWPVPRARGDITLLSKAAQSTFRISDYGYTPRVGSFVWNRDRRPTFKSKATVRLRKAKNAVPLLWSSDIKSGGRLSFDGNRKSNGEPCFVSLGSKHHPAVIKRDSVLLQRVTSNDQPKRLVAAAVPASVFTYGGFVGENHTVILEHTENTGWSSQELAALLMAPAVERYFRCISGATNVSVFELSQLPLPAPHAIRTLLNKGHDMESAVRLTVFGREPQRA